MIRVPLRHGRTLHHDIKGRFDSGKVYLRSAPSGTGVIAGGPMRAVFGSEFKTLLQNLLVVQTLTIWLELHLRH